MPNKPHSSDWDRNFGSNARRRRGPIALFVTLMLVLTFLAIIAMGASFGVDRYRQSVVAQSLTATPLWEKYYADQTATALANAATAVPTSQPTLNVARAGNLRSEPRIAPETIVGQVAPGETLAVLESRTVEDQLWYHVRLNNPAGQEGWVNSSLVTPPTP